MNRLKTFNYYLQFVAFVILTNCVSGQPGSDSEKPNVVFIFADDQRSGTLNLNGEGNTDMHTPTIDQLARDGVLFNDTYVFGADRSSVCYPSRSQMLSGKCLFRIDIDRPSKNRDDFNLPVAFRLNGYKTLRSGKGNNVPYGINPEFNINIEHTNRGSVAGNLAYFQDAKDFINDVAADHPFFVYLAVGTPHGPYPADQPAIDKYNASDITLPKDALVDHPVLTTMYNGKFNTDLKDTNEVKSDLALYYASITFMDSLMGDLFQFLKNMGEFENTIIVYTSDNGLSIGSHGLNGKSNLLEFGGMHVPMVISGPGINSDVKSDALVSLLDIFPTLCELTGSPKPNFLDGESLAPILKGDAYKVRDAVLTAYNSEQRAVRNNRWKLHYFMAENVYELYDLQNDPRELVNLIDSAELADTVLMMKQLLSTERAKFNDPYPNGTKIKRKFTKDKPFDGNIEWLDDALNTSSTKGTQNSFDIYQNSQAIRIEVNKPIESDSTAEVYSVSGKLLQSVSFSERMLTISTDNFESGIYVLKLRTGAQVITHKFVVG